jgi:hypothetical protein
MWRELMGTWYKFFCNQCSYEAGVSGGNDVGMFAETSTIHFFDCQEIMDVLTTEEPWLAMDDDWVPIDYRCNHSATHRVGLWGYPGECPKCKSTMEIDETSLIMWD